MLVFIDESKLFVAFLRFVATRQQPITVRHGCVRAASADALHA